MLANRGGTWIENGVGEESVKVRYGDVISNCSPRLWEEVRKIVEAYFLSGGPTTAGVDGF
jgi:hypothetical protein